MTVRIPNVTARLFIFLALAACGEPGSVAPDAAAANNRLDILYPPGDAIGLTYGGRETLRVRYVGELGEVIPGAAVEFAMIATGPDESTAGSTLSSATAYTDAAGIAQVDVTAGAQDGSFRVRVDARDAPTQHFYISISNGGFARLEIAPVHEGWRAPDELTHVEVRLYRASVLACSEVDVDALPASVLPPRSLAGFGEVARYPNVSAGEPHTVVAWTRRADRDVPLGVGCVDLAPSQLPNSRVSLMLPVGDRDLVLGEAPLGWRFDLDLLAAAVYARGAARPWRLLGCEAGPGQLLVDCTLDALVPDSALDCDVHGLAPLIDALEALRGARDANGCRPAVLGSSQPSLDAELTAAVVAGGSFPVGDELAALIGVRSDIASALELDSALAVPDSGGAASHRLIALRARSGDQAYTLELASTSRPVIEQRPMDARIDGNELVVGEHGFTLRHGAFAAEAFAALGLGPAGLGERAGSLGTALAASAREGQAEGCAAVSALMCRAASQLDGCMASACAQGAATLDMTMTGWWRAVDSAGIDITIAGRGTLHDDDGDRVADGIGSGEATDGAWSAIMKLSDGSSVTVPGAL